MKKPHIVIVGAGFGGLQTAKGLKGAAADLTVIDRRNHHLFQPLLYQVATAVLSPADIAVPIRSVLRKQIEDQRQGTEVLLKEVIGINPAARQVHFEEGSLAYDYLVLATGATHSYFGKNEWAEYAPGLKTIEDATSIRARLLLAFEEAEIETDPEARQALLTFVVIGGGPTGVEMAGAVAELAFQALRNDFRHIDPSQTRVILIEAGARVLASFPEKLSRLAMDDLRTLGVDVRPGIRVENVDDEGVHFTQDGKKQTVRARNVVWAAGVQASPAGKWLGVETDRQGRVRVSEDLSVPGHPEIFVIGDTSTRPGKNGHPLPGVAPVAIQQGQYVSQLIRARIQGKPFTKPFQYFDKGNLATVGRGFAVADLGKLQFAGFMGFLTWAFVHILYLVTFKNRLIVMLEWIFYYFTFRRGARLITEYPPDYGLRRDKSRSAKRDPKDSSSPSAAL